MHLPQKEVQETCWTAHAQLQNCHKHAIFSATSTSTFATVVMANDPNSSIFMRFLNVLTYQRKHKRHRCRPHLRHQNIPPCHCPISCSEGVDTSTKGNVKDEATAEDTTAIMRYFWTRKHRYPKHAPRGRVSTEDVRQHDGDDDNLSVTSNCSISAVCWGETST